MSFILYIIIAVLIIGPVYLFWAISNINRKMRKLDWLNSQEYTVLRLGVPRNNDKSPLAAEQMFAAIHGIYSESAEFQNHLSFEIVAKDKFIQFYIYLPVHLKDFVEGQIYAQYPTIEVSEVEDYSMGADFSAKNFAVCELGLNKPDVYPIKQFSDFEVDPISGITSVMSKLNPGEEVWFQMVMRPVGDEWQEKGHSMVSSVRSGKKSSGHSNKILKAFFNFFKSIVVLAINPAADLSAKSVEVNLPASVEEALKCIEQKITKLGFETKIRVASIATDSLSARMKCQNVAAAFKQYNTTNLNGFRVGDIYVNDEERIKDFVQRSFEDSGNTFNISELASIYHLPHSSVATPNIVWSGSKKGEAPANLPLRENVEPENFTVLGETNFRNTFHEFGMKTDDRRRHVYIVGKSGVGKSTLIENMALNDINAGRGVILVDPHGDTADKILACIPDHRLNDVIWFDPSDREYPIAFNLLETVDDNFKSLVASGFVGIFKKMFADSWGPRLEHILRNTVLALLDYPNSTMLDIPRMLTNNRFREKVLEKISDTVIKEFWVNEFGTFDNKFRTEAVSPILNKVGQFLSTSTIRNIVGQPHSKIDIREIMDQQKILLVNLSRGKIGEDNSALLGAMMITKIQLAAMSRADVTIDKRPDCFLYVDEFQNFATDSFSTILSEARKYNLSLAIAHQYIAQLPDSVRDAVFGNAGTIISYRVGGADADVLVKEFEPVFDNNDLVNLDKYHIYVKLLVDGISSPAFSARTLPPIACLTGNAERVVNLSHEKYSTPRSIVEQNAEMLSKSEEDELKKEAELFKNGGLEALLLKKNQEQHTVNKVQSEVKITMPQEAPASTDKSQEPVVKGTDQEINLPDTQVQEPEKNEPSIPTEQPKAEKTSEPRLVKYQQILNGRLYKERTARGGVKWYLGEEIDEEKLAKSNTILDESGRRMIEITSKLGMQKADQKNQEKVSDTKLVENQSKEDADSSKTNVEKIAQPSVPETSKQGLPAPVDNLPVDLTLSSDTATLPAETDQNGSQIAQLAENMPQVIGEREEPKNDDSAVASSASQNNANYDDAKHLPPNQPIKLDN